MDEQTIFRMHKDGNYITIHNGFAADPSLSWKAKGMMVYLLSRPPDWHVCINDLIKRAKDQRDAVYAGLKELIAAGYIHRDQERDAQGRVTLVAYYVYETPDMNPHHLPQDVDPPAGPLTPNPQAVKQQAGNPPLTKTDHEENGSLLKGASPASESAKPKRDLKPYTIMPEDHTVVCQTCDHSWPWPSKRVDQYQALKCPSCGQAHIVTEEYADGSTRITQPKKLKPAQGTKTLGDYLPMINDDLARLQLSRRTDRQIKALVDNGHTQALLDAIVWARGKLGESMDVYGWLPKALVYAERMAANATITQAAQPPRAAQPPVSSRAVQPPKAAQPVQGQAKRQFVTPELECKDRRDDPKALREWLEWYQGLAGPDWPNLKAYVPDWAFDVARQAGYQDG